MSFPPDVKEDTLKKIKNISGTQKMEMINVATSKEFCQYFIHIYNICEMLHEIKISLNFR